MDWEGMVHALEEIHRLLKPEGYLVDLHPFPEAPILEVYYEGRALLSEEFPSQSAEAYRQADRAIELIVQRHLFAVEGSGAFDFFTHSPSASALDAYWAIASAFDQEPTDKDIQARRADLFTRVDKAVNAAGISSEVVLHERGRITVLRPSA
jgi:hypothetical protein